MTDYDHLITSKAILIAILILILALVHQM
jgi:hypothetical protein